MAKAVMTLDTDTGALEVSINGAKVDKPNSVYINSGKSYDYETGGFVDRVSFEVCLTEEENGVYKYTRLMAKDTTEGKRSVAQAHPKYPDLLIKDEKDEATENALQLLRDKY